MNNAISRLVTISLACSLALVSCGKDSPNRPPPDPNDPLNAAARFAVLAGSAVSNTSANTQITGDVGVHPGSGVTGMPSGQPTGQIFSADAAAGYGQASLTVAYDNFAGRACGAVLTGDLGGRTFSPGTYCSASEIGITGALTLAAGGNPNAVFVFQAGSSLTTADGSSVVLAGGAQAKNVYWQVGSSATLGTTCDFKGNIMALSSISLANGARLSGRALARNGGVTLDNNIITLP